MALAEPAPRPPWTGRRLSIWMVTFGMGAEGFQRQGDHLPRGVAVVGGDTPVVGGEADGSGSGRLSRDRDQVVEFEGLVDGDEGVEAVRRGARRCRGRG